MRHLHSIENSDRIVFEAGSQSQIADELRALGAKRVLLVCQRGHREGAQRVADSLGTAAVGIFDRAEPQVPRETAEQAVKFATELGADWVLAHGGGTAVGVAKAVALEVDVQVAAVPTSYAGSERTNMWEITEGGIKTTGRDDRVRPRLVVYDPELSAKLPRDFTLQSLLNALAHGLEALYAADATPAATDAAMRSVPLLIGALRRLALHPGDADARADALMGAFLAGEALGNASVALHHKLAHVLGGTLRTPHALTHAVLLPYTIGYNLPAAPLARRALADALVVDDPAAGLYDLLEEIGLPTSLRKIDVPRPRLAEVADLATRRPYPNPRPFDRSTLMQLLEDAWHDRRPSEKTRRITTSGDSASRLPSSERGTPIESATMAIVAVHGRGASANRILAALEKILGARRGIALVAPQAADASWYPKAFTAPLTDNQPQLDDALGSLDRAWQYVTTHLPANQVLVVGFSQGACLAMSWLADRAAKDPRAHRAGGLVALCGAHIDMPSLEDGDFTSLRGTPVYWSHSERDPWLPPQRVAQTDAGLRRAGLELRIHVEPGQTHRIQPGDGVALIEHVERIMNNSVVGYQSGFGNAMSSEARRGALPRHQNAPREVPYGLHAEQINGTGFTVERARNRRVWLYRLRPLLPETPWEPADMGRIVGTFTDGPCSPQIQRYKPTPLPRESVDFVGGLTTFAGAGDPTQKLGMAIHIYGATADMGRRSWANVDGDLLIAPWDGRLRIRTELGLLEVGPGEIAVIPRALRFSVAVPTGSSRGFVGELYAGHLQLPERGLVGANGLADERHFMAPVADFEDVEAEHELLVKQGGSMWKNTTPFSPFDVVAWHGKYAPFKYDLRDFNSLGTVSFDHPDPSILTVLTAPADTHGRSALDVAVFLGRWDVARHTFRPPFFHRNSAIEFNMVVTAPPNTEGPWQPGTFTYSPYLSPHGVSVRGYERAISGPDGVADAPVEIPRESIWLQFESTYLLRQTRWATEALSRDENYLSSFAGYKKADVPT